MSHTAQYDLYEPYSTQLTKAYMAEASYRKLLLIAPCSLQLHWLLEMVLQGAVESKSTRLNRIFPGAVEVELERALSATPPGQCSDILNWLCGLVEEVCVCPLSTLTTAEGKSMTPWKWFPW